MSKTKQDASAGRRDFLRAVGVGAAAGAAVVVTAGSARAQAKPETAAERKKARYRETAHVKDFYRTTRY